jgi:hypothetical protein
LTDIRCTSRSDRGSAMRTRRSRSPQFVHVNRSELRQNQSSLLRKAKGKTVLVIAAPQEGEEKVVLDRAYFEDLSAKLRAAVETLEIAADRRFFSQILAAAETLETDLRKNKLQSFEEAFGGK